jgi:hypothetical protein
MCGHVGVVANKITADHRDIFTQLLYHDQVRGPHATGALAVTKDNKASVMKRALEAADFIRMKNFADLRFRADKVLAGHNRYATIGGADNEDAAHPFTYNGVTLFHNGTLSNHRGDMVGASKNYYDHESDSDVLAEAIAVHGAVPVLESVIGSYAIVWFDASEGTLNFARNDERPFWFADVGDATFWCSEEMLLRWVIKRHKTVKLKDTVALPVGEIMSLDLGTMDTEKIKFTPRERPPAPKPHARATTHPREGKEVLIWDEKSGGWRTQLEIEQSSQLSAEEMARNIWGTAQGQAYTQDDYPEPMGKLGQVVKVYPYDRYKDSHGMHMYVGWLPDLEDRSEARIWVKPSLRPDMEVVCDDNNFEMAVFATIDRIDTSSVTGDIHYYVRVDSADQIRDECPLTKGKCCGVCRYPFYVGEEEEIEYHEARGEWFHTGCLDWFNANGDNEDD